MPLDGSPCDRFLPRDGNSFIVYGLATRYDKHDSVHKQIYERKVKNSWYEDSYSILYMKSAYTLSYQFEAEENTSFLLPIDAISDENVR